LTDAYLDFPTTTSQCSPLSTHSRLLYTLIIIILTAPTTDSGNGEFHARSPTNRAAGKKTFRTQGCNPTIGVAPAKKKTSLSGKIGKETM